MRFLKSALSAAVAMGLLSACSENTGSQSAMLPNGGAQSRLDSFSATGEHPEGHIKPALTPQETYVADSASSQVTVYNHSGTYQFTIATGVCGPDFITFDTLENLYVANIGCNSVTEYAPLQKTPSLVIKSSPECPISKPRAVAIDGAGNIYVASSGNSTVTIYNSQGGCEGVLTQNISGPQALGFDSTGVLYVANSATLGNSGSVAVCSGIPLTCSKTITAKIDNPRALAFDSSNDLFVANDVSISSVPEGNVTEYLPAAKSNTFVSAYLSGDVDFPNALAFDLTGNLCVSSGGNNKVLCFSLKTHKFTHQLMSGDGISLPVSIAIGPTSDWVKVANDFSPGSVTQYCPKPSCTTPNPTIVKNIHSPTSIAIGP
jgi:hypothetical protein